MVKHCQLMKNYLLILGFLIKTASVLAADFYFVSIFSYQDDFNRPRFSHSFATFSHAVDQGQDAALYRITENQTISWLPASGELVLLSPPEPGRNRDLQETFRIAYESRRRVSEWGPYQTTPELFARAARKIEELNSGRIFYKMLDQRFRPFEASNCIHAIADLDMDRGLLDSGTLRGEDASALIVSHLSRWFVSNQSYPWIDEKLGIRNFPINHR